MLCLKEEALGLEMYSSHGALLPVNLGRSILKALHWVGKGRWEESQSRRSDPSSSSSGEGSAVSCSGIHDGKSNNGLREKRHQQTNSYRTHLEQEVQRLQLQLQEEIDLHVALVNAVAHNAAPSLNSPSPLPDKAQDLLDNIATLEATISQLEVDLTSLQLRLCQERNERHLAESHLDCLSSVHPEATTSSSTMWEEHVYSLRVSKFGFNHAHSSLEQDLLSGRDTDSHAAQSLNEYPVEELLGPPCKAVEGIKMEDCLQQSDAFESKNDIIKMNLLNHPNHLSEEMVNCMRNIFLCLAQSTDISSKSYSDRFTSQYSPADHLSSSSSTSYSCSSLLLPTSENPSTGIHQSDKVVDVFDPYGVNGKPRDIGSYSFAAEVSWMSVGKEQLQYAAEALKDYRFLVDQLEKVNPACMSGNERLAFWINIYNALIMHAYLAYGVPKSEMKLFNLMQKASYIVGGQSFSAAEIEFVILKMKPPEHRPQLALILAIHKFKISEKNSKFSIDNSEPLLLFALSCGMYSSPAVRVFTAENVHDELRISMRDFIRASVGISEKGKLLVPKLLYCFANGIVEDSLLVDWICQYLSPDQVTIVRDSILLQKQRLLGVRSFSVMPFDSSFRYLFLCDDKKPLKSLNKGFI